MIRNRRMPGIAITFAVAMSVPLGLLKFWPFAIIFYVLGGVFAGVISVMTGYEHIFIVVFLGILCIEYLLTAMIILILLLFR